MKRFSRDKDRILSSTVPTSFMIKMQIALMWLKHLQSPDRSAM